MANFKARVKVPKSAKKGEVFEVKTLASHVMETGLRKGKDGKPIPPHDHQQVRLHLQR